MTFGTGLSLESANLEPPFVPLTWLKQRRGRGGIRLVVPARRGLDRDLPVAAEVAVADPDRDVWREVRVPSQLDRRARLPAEREAVDRRSGQEQLGARSLTWSRHADVHPRLISEQRMRAPVGGLRIRAGVAIDVRDQHIVAKLDRPGELPRHH